MCVFVSRGGLKEREVCLKSGSFRHSFSPHRSDFSDSSKHLFFPSYLLLFLTFFSSSLHWTWHLVLLSQDKAPLTAPLKTKLGSHLCVVNTGPCAAVWVVYGVCFPWFVDYQPWQCGWYCFTLWLCIFFIPAKYGPGESYCRENYKRSSFEYIWQMFIFSKSVCGNILSSQ